MRVYSLHSLGSKLRSFAITVNNTCILLMNIMFDLVALFGHCMIIQIRKTFDDNDSNTAKEKQKNPWSLFTRALISKNLSFSDFLLTLLPLQMKNCLFFYVYIILACLLIRLYGHSLVNGSIL